MGSLALHSIDIGIRHRRDFGDVDALAASIAEVGLLHPIVVRPDGRLIAGERRLKACQQLGWTNIPVTVVDLDEVARGELAENAWRKNFLPSEIEAIRRALEPSEKAAATSRKVSGRSVPNAGEARDKIGAFAGISGRTVEKIAAVVAAAEAEPGKFGKLLADMDRTGRVDGPFKRLQIMRKADAIRAEPPPLPGKGPYRVIVADPPWPYELRKEDPSHRATHPYPQMSIDEIAALDVAAIAHQDAMLWLWTTNHHLLGRAAFTVLDAWGFAPITMLTWGKQKFGFGERMRGQTEHCILASRGQPTFTLTNESTLLLADAGRNSEKPDEFYALVESLCPASRYAELFQRRDRPNWDGHGDEAARAA